ncbi:MAG: Hpt domain-containing protein [Firmicutes bacterium]|jgi:HPt (histidine-containing phosphotransfer) domain-containing protein|nr:Hpt domain-containing protein [Bacillota bacterium]
MTVKQCYEAMEANYEEVESRLRTEERIKKFLLKVLNDKSYDLLCTSIEQNNMEEAFRAAHTLKGISQNLSLTILYQSAGNLSDILRESQQYNEAAAELFEQVKKDYEKVTEAIKKLS